MKIKSIVKYSLRTYMPVFLVYWGIMFAILTFFVLLSIFTGDSVGMVGGMDSISVIFLLIVGITGYRESLSMAIQNGVSRKTYFLGTVLFFVIFALICSAGDTSLTLIGNLYESQSPSKSLLFDSTYEQFFGSISDDTVSAIADYMKGFVMQFCLDFAAFSAGLLISAVFCRVNKVMKFVIPLGIYVIGFVVFPFVDYVLFDSFIIEKLRYFMMFVSERVGYLSVTTFIGGVVLLAVSYLFIRRVQIADRK